MEVSWRIARTTNSDKPDGGKLDARLLVPDTRNFRSVNNQNIWQDQTNKAGRQMF